MSVLVALLVFVTPTFAAKQVDTCATIKDGTIQYGRPNTTSITDIIHLGYDKWGYNYQAHTFNGYMDNSGRPSEVATSGDWLQMKWSDKWLSNQDCLIQTGFDGNLGTSGNDHKLDRHAGYETYRGSGAWLTNHASGTYQSTINGRWDIAGNWVIAVNGLYNHDYTFAMTSLPDGTFTGVGGYPAGALDYTFDEVVVNGQITGNTVAFTATYYAGGVPTGYSWNATGEIDASGHFVNGTGTSGVSEWHSTSGVATKVMDMCKWSDFVKIVAAPSTAYLVEDNWMEDGVVIGPAIWGDFAIIQEVSDDSCGELDLDSIKSKLRSGLGNWSY